MILLFYGDDVKLIKIKVDEWEKDIFKNHQHLDKILLESFNPSVFINATEETLFSDLRYIKVYVQKKDDINSILKLSKKSDIIAIIFYTEKPIDGIDKSIKTFPFFLPKPYQIANILIEKFSKKIDPIVIDFLSKNITSLYEIEKIDYYLKNNPDKVIKIKDLPYIIEEIDVSVFSIIDDIINRKIESALNSIINFINVSEYGVLIKNLFSTIKMLYTIKKMIVNKVNDQAIIKKFNLHQIILKKYIEIAKKLDISELENLLIFFPILDLNSKKFLTDYFVCKLTIDF
ncbi:MAG TPA: hypothetical protein PKW55_03165 [Spirochaetota bacterium]|nr:hypothetical protein [Spirochaetota bacterium]HOM38149.1 hypothetical protein [Spirochaetota bacterium]HPQ48633.1 hypothetical protein [Spirochaetota bacterium]